MSLTGSHKNQYVDQVYRMITSLPALSLSPLHTLSTTKHCPKLQKPKMKHFGWKIPQFLSSDIANSFPLSLPLSNTSNPPITLEHSIDPLRFLSPFVAQTHFLIHQLKSENSGNLSPWIPLFFFCSLYSIAQSLSFFKYTIIYSFSHNTHLVVALWVYCREIYEPSVGMVLFLTVFIILSIYFIKILLQIS